MKQYLDLMRHVYENGVYKHDRTGTGTRSVFGHQMRFDLKAGFPLVTTKKVHLRSIIHELIWFLRGGTTSGYARESGVRLRPNGSRHPGAPGPVYGSRGRSAPEPGRPHTDQWEKGVQRLKTSPNSRRIIGPAWSVAEIEYTALPP